MSRFDETWHRLREWTGGQTPSERLSAQVLLREGYENVDPSHPLGGPDTGLDARCTKDGKDWIMGVYFARGQQTIGEITSKFKSDLAKASTHNPDGFVFVTNQELTLSQRKTLGALGEDICVELYHLERVALVLDMPVMAPVRKQFLDIDPGPLPIKVELHVDGSASFFTGSETALENYIASVSVKKKAEFERDNVPPVRGIGFQPVRVNVMHSAMFGTQPEKPRTAEQLDRMLEAWADRVRNDLEGSENYLAARAWTALGFELRNVGDVFLNDVQIIITIDGAFGVPWEGDEEFELAECIEPFSRPTRGAFTPLPQPNLSHLRSKDYPISWKNEQDEGKVEIIIDLKHLRPHPAWRSDQGDLVLFVLDDSASSLTAEWTVTAQGYGNVYNGPAIEIPVESSPFAETLVETNNAASRNRG